MQVILSQDEIIKILRVCLTDSNLLNMSTLGIVLDYPTLEYSQTRKALESLYPTQVDILIEMLKTGKRVYFIDQFNGTNHEFDISLEYAVQRLKGHEAMGAVISILGGNFTEEDCMIALQYIVYGRYKYPCL